MRWLLVVLSLMVPATARAELDPARASNDARAAVDKYGFCSKPPKRLSPRTVLLCPHARATPGCSALAVACDELEKKSEPRPFPGWIEKALRAIGPLLQVLLWVIVVAVVVGLAIPLILAWIRSRRDKVRLDDDEPAVARVEVPAAEEALEVHDAEVLLARASEHERHGDLSRALSTYLAAALRGLDMRGAIRLERHRTNGEYVRAVADPSEKDALRAIAREVDHVEYGGRPATPGTVSAAAKRAIALVRKLPLLILLMCGCASDAMVPGRDPAGDEVLRDVLTAQGIKIVRAGAIVNLPIPATADEALLFDASRTPLDEESEPHLLRWVKSGGVLILAGGPARWPRELKGSFEGSTSAELAVTTWDDDEQIVYPAHAARAGGMQLPGGFKIAETRDGVMWAATRELGRGRVIAMADVDLITNVGLARPDNAAALIAILSSLDDYTLRIARPEDGTSPPSNPFTALVRAGLGPGLAHALLATLLLFLAFGARLTRAAPTPPPHRRAFAEHVEATGALWARTRLSPHALRVYARWVEEQMRGRSHDPLFERAREARSDEPARGDELRTMRALGELLDERKP